MTKLSHERAALLATLAEMIAGPESSKFRRVAVDGVDGAGKTTFSDELGTFVQSLGRPVIRASVDDFHNPRETRYRLGRRSPEGFYLDSYDYAALRNYLLEPLAPGGSGRYRRATFNHIQDRPVAAAEFVAPENAVLIFDGIFLHRPELRECWDFSIFLAVPFAVSIPRGASRGEAWGSPDPAAESNRRYIEGQKLYLRESDPHSHANVVVDNSDLSKPRIVRRSKPPQN